MLTIKEIFLQYKPLLKLKNIETYSLDVDVFLMNVTGFSKADLYVKYDYKLTEEQFDLFKSFFKRRLKNEPVAYIIGMCEFMGLKFFLNKDTLIPRPDTEILVETAIDFIKKEKLLTGLDIGTGSGAIAVSILKYCQNVKMVACDINQNALDKAFENASYNNVLENMEFVQSNIFENINQKFDFIISNPPYIKTDEIKKLSSNVKDFEPLIALDGHSDGLFFYNAIIKELHLYLKKGGYVFFEIGHDQADDVISILNSYNFSNITLLKDLSALDRVVFAKYI